MKNVYTDYYYNFLVGEYPTDEDYRTTSLTFEYLEDAKFTSNEIVNIICSLPINNAITFDLLPDYLWEDSLIERNKFYFHKELQILSPPPTWEKTFPFYLEMKIRYTLDDVLNYFIRMSGVRQDWINREKEIGSIKYLLNNYKKFKFMEPLDFLLHLIDFCISKEVELNQIYDLTHYEIELAEYLEVDTTNAIANNKNQIIWRS